jgi:outer membrane protein assembly factor BamB
MYRYTLLVLILGIVAKHLSQSSWIFGSTPVAKGICAYPKNKTLWVYYWSLLIGIILVITGCTTFTPSSPPLAPLPSFTPSWGIKTNWHIRLNGHAQTSYATLNPAYNNGNLFITTPDGIIAAVVANSGKILWRNKLQESITTGAGVGNGLVVIGTSQAQLFALDEKTGRVIWEANLSNIALATPVIAQNQVFVKTQDDRLYAFDIHSGKTLWIFQQSIPNLVLRAGGSPQVAGNWVIAGFANGNFVILDRRTGKIVWQNQLGTAFGVSDIENMEDIDDTPLIIDGVIYVAAYQGQLMAMSLATKQTLWQQPLSADTSITADNQQVYAADTDGNVWAFERDSGAVAWKQNALAGRQLTAPVLLGQRLVIADMQGNVYWLAVDDGHILARIVLDGQGISATPVVVNQAVGIYTNSSQLILVQPMRTISKP